MDPKQHICVLCSRLDLPGGIERAISNTANLFAREGHAVTVLILDRVSKSFYPLEEKVQVIQQPLSFGITTEGNIVSRKIRLLSDVLKLRKLLKQLRPQIIIATEYPFVVSSVLCGAKKNAKVISWEHHHFHWIKKNKFWTALFSRAYTRLDNIVCLNSEEAKHYQRFAPVKVIPNFVTNPLGEKAALDNSCILSIGWLIPRKGIDLLLQAAKKLLSANPDWKWKLIGEGEMKKQVMDFIASENLQNRFILQAPAGDDLSSEYLQSSVFVLTSRFEAFPMVLLEAMSFGVPCVSFDCPTGPADIISHKADGLLVEKENFIELADAISGLINDSDRRKKMGELAFRNSRRFAPDNVYDLWLEAFK